MNMRTTPVFAATRAILAAGLLLTAHIAQADEPAKSAKAAPATDEQRDVERANAEKTAVKPAAKTVDRWEKDIAAMLAKDTQAPPPVGGIVFTGSSSIRLWNLAQAFPDLPVVNRGFGGSQIHDATRYAPRIVTPLKPKLVVFYSGDNDIKSGKPPERTAADFQAFCAAVHKELPSTRIWFIAIKPCPSRWNLIEQQKTANDLIRKQCEADPKRLLYVDIVPAMLGADGQPNKELFVKDMLHMSPAGYQIWNTMLHQLLAKHKPLD